MIDRIEHHVCSAREDVEHALADTLKAAEYQRAARRVRRVYHSFLILYYIYSYLTETTHDAGLSCHYLRHTYLVAWLQIWPI